MGFGILLVGYFFAYLMANISPAFAFAGAYLMILGAIKLKDYNTKFSYVIYPSGAIMLIALKDTVLDILSIFGTEPAFFGLPAVETVFNLMQIGAAVLLHLTLYLAVADIASEVGVDKIRVSAWRNLWFFIAYTAICAVRYLPISYGDVFLSYLNLIIRFMQLLWIFFSIFMLFSCFRNIGDKEKVEMEMAEYEDDEGGKNNG